MSTVCFQKGERVAVTLHAIGGLHTATVVHDRFNDSGVGKPRFWRDGIQVRVKGYGLRVVARVHVSPTVNKES